MGNPSQVDNSTSRKEPIMGKLKRAIVGLALAAGALVASATEAIKAPFTPTYSPLYGLTASPVERAVWSIFGPIARWLLAPFGGAGLSSVASMLDTAYQTQYRDEFIAAFEAKQTLLRETVTTEAVIKGQQAVFLVAGSGGDIAKTRGANGLIPARNDNLAQNTVILSEWHDLVRKTGFNIFASQGNQRQIMQQTSMMVMNRKIDDQIITILNTGTVAIGAAGAVPTVSLFQNGRVKLSNASVPWDSNVTFACQPSVLAFLEQAPEFSNADYVDTQSFSGSEANSPTWRDKPMAYRWRNCLIIEHPNLPGKATASEKSFLYHKTALGHAANSGFIETAVGYNDEQAYTYARTTCYMQALLLQNAGIVVFTTDGTIYG
jgi:hypothetical protein